MNYADNTTLSILGVAITSTLLITSGCSKACKSQDQATIRDPSGLTFTITETNCDTLGNDTAVTIYVDNPQGPRKSIMKYGPDERSGPPRITTVGSNTIVIAIDSVAEIVNQSSHYMGYGIRYEIGHVAYPANVPVKRP